MCSLKSNSSFAIFYSDRNECDPNPCLNNGVCIDGINTYSCGCKGGYAGKNCETSKYISIFFIFDFWHQINHISQVFSK